ncbi:hypothetical protein AwErysi_09080 [Erysipelotrichaceae bacterium]|nr:hypothetical protein AwErysi_09080 [Erysipelotrichaceae bacterium]
MRRVYDFPDGYHGKTKKKDFFEGWYFKLTNKDATETFACIPGVFYGKTETAHHGFLQILLGKEVGYHYLKYPTTAFSAKKEELDVKLHKSHFTKEQIHLDEQLEDGRNFRVDVRIKSPFFWAGTRLNPGSMGFFNYIPFMECYMQTCMMRGTLTGEIHIDGREIDMTGGSIYIEKNWGKSFPKAWVWIQANKFEDQTQAISLSCAVGKVPFCGATFSGFMIGLTINEAFYAFTTHNFSKIELKLDQEIPKIIVWNNKYELSIVASAPADSFILCKGPKLEGVMYPFVRETLQGQVEINLRNKKTGACIFSGRAEAAGIELTNRELFNKSEKK